MWRLVEMDVDYIDGGGDNDYLFCSWAPEGVGRIMRIVVSEVIWAVQVIGVCRGDVWDGGWGMGRLYARLCAVLDSTELFDRYTCVAGCKSVLRYTHAHRHTHTHSLSLSCGCI
jgi:hypothetical protein